MYRLLAVFLLATPAFCTVVYPCDGYPEVPYVQVGDCEDNCKIPVQKNLTTAVFLQPGYNVTSVKFEMTKDGETILYSEDACKVEESPCPLREGELSEFVYNIFTTEDLIGDGLYTTYFSDQDSKVFGCFQMMANVYQP